MPGLVCIRVAEQLQNRIQDIVRANRRQPFSESPNAFRSRPSDYARGVAERLKDEVAEPEAEHPKFAAPLAKFDEAMADDLNTAIALTALEDALAVKKVSGGIKRAVIEAMDAVLGLNLFGLSREELRIRPVSAEITEAEIEDALARRKAARAEKDFATSDAIRDELVAKGVEVMDGDPLGWDWMLA